MIEHLTALPQPSSLLSFCSFPSLRRFFNFPWKVETKKVLSAFIFGLTLTSTVRKQESDSSRSRRKKEKAAATAAIFFSVEKVEKEAFTELLPTREKMVGSSFANV